LIFKYLAGVFAWLDPSLPTFTGVHTNQPWGCGPQPSFSKSSAYTPTVQGCGALQLVSGAICMNDWWFSELLPFICKKGIFFLIKFNNFCLKLRLFLLAQ
jgi:hypothetical protein